MRRILIIFILSICALVGYAQMNDTIVQLENKIY